MSGFFIMFEKDHDIGIQKKKNETAEIHERGLA